MKLELQKAKVKNIAWGDKTALLADGTLQINKEEFIAAAADSEHFKTLDADLARPGESVRVCPVKDVIEPRYKTEGSGQVFPGMLSDVETVGSGKTFVLEGAAVLTCGRIVGFQEGIIDMQGPGADYTPFSKTMNAVLVFEPVEGLEAHEYEKACRMAGFRAAFYIAEAAWKAGAHVDTTETYELPCFAEAMKAYPELPKVAYIYMLQTQGLLHDTYLYAADLRPSLPTLIHPNEVLDGAMVSGNCVSGCDKNTTWHHCHNPIVQALYARHGKEINFLGMVPTQESTILAGKLRASQLNLSIAQQLGADGVIVSEEGYGNPDTDLCLNAKNFEKAGIKAVLVSDESAGTDGASQSLADATPELNAFISTGNVNEMIEVPAMDKVIGYPEQIALLSGGAAESLRPDGSMYVELQSIIASTAEIGFNKLGCEWV